ncbi:hypothetical protein JTE90_009210 [Oedothorax gibbosus]|uniref:Uncharacterized protein n=1 Tax=Oedothorax gibbosus TaxID=931172 RepID=A0AAV6UYA8_9ARAC|nr:hypothetical protein JTE90_009210 [Oedothorax gibbosus]
MLLIRLDCEQSKSKKRVRFTLTNGFASHCEDACSDVYKRLKYVLLCLEVGQVICADTLTYNVLKAAIQTSTPSNVLHDIECVILRDFDFNIGVCHECDKECHRYRAIIATSKHMKFRFKLIPHP